MKRAAFTLAILLVLMSASMYAQDTHTCKYVVKQVSFENPSYLTAQQLAKLRTLVIGPCYDQANATVVSQYVYDQLRALGFKKPTVYDPNIFQVLDTTLHPSPVSIAIDFRLHGLDGSAE